MGATLAGPLRVVLAIAFTLFCNGALFAANPYACQFKPSANEVSHVESHLVLPSDATKVTTYKRGYVGISLYGERKIFGYMIRGNAGEPGSVRRHRTMGTIDFINHLNHCESAFVLYNLTADKVQLVRCDFIKESIPGVPYCPL